MPLINGQKMACEPCIRGHRSTKCTHANERLMVPVRKPGRPLSSCPHPASKPCNCGTVTAAIPRRQTCGCGTSNSTTPQSKAETEETSPATSPDEPRPTPTPSTTSSSNFRVQKTKGGSNRKMSIDPASLDRMDSNQLNVLPSPSSYGGNGNGLPTGSVGMANGHIPAMAGLNHYPVMGMQGAEHAFSPQPIMFPLFHPHMPSPMMAAAPAPAPTPAPSVKSLKTPSASAQPAAGSCCGGGAVEKRNSESSQSDTSPGHSTPQPSTQRTNGEAPKASCCSSKPANNDLSSGTLTPPEHAFPSPNEMMMAPFQHQIALANGMYGLFPQPTVFTYPPQYGTFMQPLQPEQWRQVMASIAFGQMAQPHQAFDMGASMAGAVPFSTITNPHSGTSHRCSCGDGCQCVGCAAHPYNEATQNYVRSAWSSMTEEANGAHTPHANGNHVMANGHSHNHNHNHDHHHNHHGHNGLNGNHASTNGNHIDTTSVTDPALTDANGGQSSAQQESGTSTGPQTPSDTPSSITEEQALSASDFFFVTYPFGDSCAGETASCPCGDDCQCIGCVIHNNPAPE